MAELELRKIRPLGKLEEISAAAHHIDFFTNTGLAVHYKALQPSLITNVQQTIYNALAVVARLHPVLFAVPVVAEIDTPYWGRLKSIDLERVVSFVQRRQEVIVDGDGRDRELDVLLEEQHNTSFKSGYGTLPVWRLIILQDHGLKHQFTACFIAHHSMSDGIGLQVFHNAFQKALSDTSSFSSATEAQNIIFSNDGDPIPPSLEELHPLPLPATAPEGNTSIFNEWTGSPVEVPCRTRYESLSLAPHLMQPFTVQCRKNKVAPTAALPSLVARLLYNNLPSTAESLTCNIPVSLRADLPPKTVEGVMGNYIDAFKVKLLRSDLEDQSSNDPQSLGLWNHARKIQEATRKYFGNVSPSGQPYTNIAFFKLIPDLKAALTGTLGTARGESFEVSNLGKFSQPINAKGLSWQAGKVMLSRCAYAAGGPLVVCVLSSDENVGFGFTWQDGAIADDVVENVIKGLRTYFVSLQES